MIQNGPTMTSMPGCSTLRTSTFPAYSRTWALARRCTTRTPIRRRHYKFLPTLAAIIRTEVHVELHPSTLIKPLFAVRCRSPARCSGCDPHPDGYFRSWGSSRSCATATCLGSALATSGHKPFRAPPPRLSGQSRGSYRGPSAEEPSQACLQHASPPIPQIVPEFETAHFPIMRHNPNDPKHILKLLKRSADGRAMCLWSFQGGGCGFVSQVDLVKRHIKRVHYRLR